MIDRGAISFVIHKIKSGNSPEHIIELLSGMGYDKVQISEAFDRAGHSLRTRHQDIVAQNDFLPPLNKHGQQDVSEHIVDLRRSRLHRNNAPVRSTTYATPTTPDKTEVTMDDSVVEIVEEAYIEEDPGYLEDTDIRVKSESSIFSFFRLLGSLIFFLSLIIIGTVVIYYALNQTNLVNRLMQL
jgi:hypothetical protein